VGMMPDYRAARVPKVTLTDLSRLKGSGVPPMTNVGQAADRWFLFLARWQLEARSVIGPFRLRSNFGTPAPMLSIGIVAFAS
jgi:hypothetical protein